MHIAGTFAAIVCENILQQTLPMYTFQHGLLDLRRFTFVEQVYVIEAKREVRSMLAKNSMQMVYSFSLDSSLPDTQSPFMHKSIPKHQTWSTKLNYTSHGRRVQIARLLCGVLSLAP